MDQLSIYMGEFIHIGMMSSFDEGDENDMDQVYRPSNYYSDCLDMDEDLRD